MTAPPAPLAPLVAITGAGGFIGTHLVRGFDARGARVLPLVRQVTATAPAGARALDAALDDASLLSGVDTMVHAASVRSRHGVMPAETQAANVALVERAMQACARAAVRRFVLVSSVGVYGFPADLPVTEAHAYAPRTVTAATKVESEMRARRVARDLGLDLVVARPATVYGPGDREGMLEWMASMMRAGVYRIVGSGENVMHHVHVDDVVDGLWRAATHPAAAGDHFILAGPETITLARLSALVARATGRELPEKRVPASVARALATVVDAAAYKGLAFVRRDPPLNHEKLDLMTLPIWFDIQKARRVLGFDPHVGYDEGVMRTLRGEWPVLSRIGAQP